MRDRELDSEEASPASRTVAAVSVLMAVMVAPAFSQGSQGSLDRLGWLAGCWEGRSGDRVTFEMWMPPAGGLMLGATRTVARAEVRSTEILRLEVRDGDFVYTAHPAGQTETSFRSTAVTDSGFTVENPAHDFPTKIQYTRRGNDSLLARIEGPGRDGGTHGIDFPYRRVVCSGSP